MGGIKQKEKENYVKHTVLKEDESELLEFGKSTTESLLKWSHSVTFEIKWKEFKVFITEISKLVSSKFCTAICVM